MVAKISEKRQVFPPSVSESYTFTPSVSPWLVTLCFVLESDGSFEQMYPIHRHQRVFIVANHYQTDRLQSIQCSHYQLYQYFVNDCQTPKHMSSIETTKPMPHTRLV